MWTKSLNELSELYGNIDIIQAGEYIVEDINFGRKCKLCDTKEGQEPKKCPFDKSGQHKYSQFDLDKRTEATPKPVAPAYSKKTLQMVLDNILGYPKYIYRSDGQVFKRTSKKMIEDGKVTVDGITTVDPEAVVKPGAHIRWGIYKYNREVGEVV